MSGLGGFLFGVARDVLNTLLNYSLQNKQKKIIQEQVREELLKYISENNLTQQTNINIQSLDILIQEIYSLANHSNRLSVSDGNIEIRPRSLLPFQIPFSELVISNKIKNIHKRIEQTLESESKNSGEEIFFKGTENIPNQNYQLQENYPSKQKDVLTIIYTYKSKIQAEIEEEARENKK